MFTGPVGPVEVFFYWPEVVFGNFYWPGAIGSPLASSPVNVYVCMYYLLTAHNDAKVAYRKIRGGGGGGGVRK